MRSNHVHMYIYSTLPRLQWHAVLVLCKYFTTEKGREDRQGDSLDSEGPGYVYHTIGHAHRVEDVL